MRCNWRRWLWGLIPLVMLSWVAIQVEQGGIERDLDQRVGKALTDAGAGWAKVAFNGRDAQLSGNAIQDSQPPEAERVASGVWGVRIVDNRASLPPKVEPFLWSARRRGNRIRLVGYVPNRSTRRTIIGMTKAALPGFEVVDRMTVARGVPPVDTWLAGLSFGLKQLTSLDHGTVRFEDLALTITGEAEDVAGYRMVTAALKSGLPKGITLANARIGAPVVSPFTWSAKFAGGQLVLSGHVAGESARSDLAAAAAASLGSNVVDRMELAEGAPRGWAAVAAAAVKELTRLQSGNAETKDAALTINGLAADEAVAQSVRAALKAALPANFKLNDQIRVREPVKPPEPAPTKAEPAPAPPAPPAPKASEPAPPAPPAPKASEPAPPAPPAPKASEPAPLPPVEPAPSQAAPAQPPHQDVAPKQAEVRPPAPKQAEPTPPAAAAPTQPEPAPKQAAPTPPPVKLAEPTPPPARQAEQTPPPAKQAEPAPPPVKQAEPVPPKQPEPAAKQAEQPPPPEPKRSEPDAKFAAAAPPPAPPSPPAAAAVLCQESLNKIAGAGPILFDSDSATIDDASLDVLNRLAAAAKQCPGVRIAIEGHADIEGSAEYNQRLSVRRAQAVVAHLVKAGADAEQLEAIGLGASRPVAPNTSAENKARNRRIEFVVRRP